MDALVQPGALRLSTSRHNGVVTVTVAGELDIATTGQLRAVAEDALRGGARQLTLEMTEVSFIAADGLGVLVALATQARRQDTRLVLGKVSPAVARLLEITSLDRHFTMEPS